MGWFCQKSRFQFLGAKMVENPETPGISPDTPDLEHSGEKLRVLIRILQKFQKFRIEFWIFRVLQKCGRRVVSGSGSCIRFRLVSGFFNKFIWRYKYYTFFLQIKSNLWHAHQQRHLKGTEGVHYYLLPTYLSISNSRRKKKYLL